MLAVHLLRGDDDRVWDAGRDRVRRVDGPDELALALVAPLEAARGAEHALEDLGVVARVQDEQAHAAEHGLVDAGDDRVVDVVVGDVAPPGQDVGRVDHLLRKAVIGLVERGGAELDLRRPAVRRARRRSRRACLPGRRSRTSGSRCSWTFSPHTVTRTIRRISTTNTLRAGVVGVGWAGEQHAEAYAKLPGVELAGIAGLEEPVRTELATRLGVERHVATWEELFEDDSLDVVSVAVPTFLHAPIAIAALERGLHVLSEKPIARTSEEADAMLAAARAGGTRARRRVQSPSAQGHPECCAASSRPVGSASPTTRRRGGCGAPASRRSARGSPTVETAGGGPLVDLGVHVLDYALFLLGQPNGHHGQRLHVRPARHGRLRRRVDLGQDGRQR